jgi:PAS domain S-box-containing protein
VAQNDECESDGASFQTLFEQSPDALIFSDPEGFIRKWNRAAERVFGYTGREVTGRSLDVLIPERFRDAHWRGFRHAIKSGSTKYSGRALTTRALHKEGFPLYVELTFALIRDADNNVLGVLAAARDCTDSYLERKALRERTPASEKDAGANAPALGETAARGLTDLA